MRYGVSLCDVRDIMYKICANRKDYNTGASSLKINRIKN